MPIARNITVALILAFVSSSGWAATKAPACSEGCLLDMVNRYLDAMTAHDASALPIAQGLRVTENGKTIHLGGGLWQSAQAVVYRQTIVDPSTEQAVFFGVVKEESDHALLTLRLAVSGDKITEIESMVARTGAHPLFNPAAITSIKPIWITPVAAEDRLPRARLVEIANSYFDGIEKHSADAVPFHPDCNRTENGIQTTNSDSSDSMNLSCSAGIKTFGYIKKVRGRRFPVADPAHGLVVAIVQFDMPGQPGRVPIPADSAASLSKSTRTLFLCELFKIENGRIREIQAFMRNEPLGSSNGWN